MRASNDCRAAMQRKARRHFSGLSAAPQRPARWWGMQRPASRRLRRASRQTVGGAGPCGNLQVQRPRRICRATCPACTAGTQRTGSSPARTAAPATRRRCRGRPRPEPAAPTGSSATPAQSASTPRRVSAAPATNVVARRIVREWRVVHRCTETTASRAVSGCTMHIARAAIGSANQTAL